MNVSGLGCNSVRVKCYANFIVFLVSSKCITLLTLSPGITVKIISQ